MDTEVVPNKLFRVGSRTRLTADDYDRLADSAVDAYDLRAVGHGHVHVLLRGMWDTSANAFLAVAVEVLGNNYSPERARRLRAAVLSRLDGSGGV